MLKRRREKKIAKTAEESELNELSQRHLENYNENVKQLEDRRETPDNAHAVFETSKSKKKVKKARLFRKKN